MLGAALGVEGCLCGGTMPVLTFAPTRSRGSRGSSAAFHDVQFQVDVRRTNPLALKLTRLGGAEMLDGLVRALRALAV